MPSMCRDKSHIEVNDKRVLEALFNDTVYTEFLVCFTTAKYENDILFV